MFPENNFVASRRVVNPEAPEAEPELGAQGSETIFLADYYSQGTAQTAVCNSLQSSCEKDLFTCFRTSASVSTTVSLTASQFLKTDA